MTRIYIFGGIAILGAILAIVGGLTLNNCLLNTASIILVSDSVLGIYCIIKS